MWQFAANLAALIRVLVANATYRARVSQQREKVLHLHYTPAYEAYVGIEPLRAPSRPAPA